MLKKVLSVFWLLLILTAMLGFGAFGGRDAVADAVEAETGSAENDVMGIGVTHSLLRVRKGPSLTAEIVTVLRAGQEVTVYAEENGFYRITAEVEGEAEGSVETVKGYVRMQNIFLKKDEK